MSYKHYYNSLLFLLLVLLASCGEEPSEASEAEKFVRIYDHSGFTESFSPIDVRQTPDKGYLILASVQRHTETLQRGVYLLKVDQYGNFVRDQLLESAYVSPVRGMQFVNGNYYFFCMDDASRAVLMSVDPEMQGLTAYPTALSYPAAVSYTDNDGFLVLSYNQVDKKMVFSRVNPTGGVSVSRMFKVADDDSMEDVIMQHFLGTGRQFPFGVGKLSNGNYFYNGFYDYTFSFVVTGLSADDDVNHFIHGQHENGGFSAIRPLTSNTFAASYFNFGANYFLPQVSLANGGSSISGLGGFNMRELVPNASVSIEALTINEKAILMYATDIKSKQIGLFFYDQTTASLVGTRYLGFSNPYELGRAIPTEDGGLVVCGTTYISGRFPRICLFKIGKNELTEIIQ